MFIVNQCKIKKFEIYLLKKFFPRATKLVNNTVEINDHKKIQNQLSGSYKKIINQDSDESDDEELKLKTKEGIKLDPKFEEYFMAQINNSISIIPEEMQIKAHRVFSKHSFSDIKFWTQKFLLNYCQNHACEPPVSLKGLKQNPFANSEEIDIKTKFFKNKDEKKKGDDKDIKLDDNITIDIEEEKKLNKDKTNINPIAINYTQAHAVAYLYCRMPYSYNTNKRVLEEILLRMPNFKPVSVLDYGAGLGSAVWAACDVFDEQLIKLAAIEPNRDMRRLGKFLTSGLKKEIVWAESLTMIPGTGIDRGKFDLVQLSYVLQEVPTAKLRIMIIDTLWNRLNNDGILVVIEPGSPKGYRFIHDLREWVLSKTRDEASIIAPCPHHLECPIASRNKDWCHFSQLSYKWSKQIVPKPPKEKNIYNEKFSYLIIKKGKTPNAIFDKEEEATTAEDKSFFWERILRPVIRKHRHSILDLCTKYGRLERRIIGKSHGTIGGYKTSKRLNWGDLWYIPYWLPNKYRKEGNKGKRLW